MRGLKMSEVVRELEQERGREIDINKEYIIHRNV